MPPIFFLFLGRHAYLHPIVLHNRIPTRFQRNRRIVANALVPLDLFNNILHP